MVRVDIWHLLWNEPLYTALMGRISALLLPYAILEPSKLEKLLNTHLGTLKRSVISRMHAESNLTGLCYIIKNAPKLYKSERD